MSAPRPKSERDVRDEIEKLMQPSFPMSVWQWDADQLNMLFLHRGIMKQPANISPETIRNAILDSRGY